MFIFSWSQRLVFKIIHVKLRFVWKALGDSRSFTWYIAWLECAFRVLTITQIDKYQKFPLTVLCWCSPVILSLCYWFSYFLLRLPIVHFCSCQWFPTFGHFGLQRIRVICSSNRKCLKHFRDSFALNNSFSDVYLVNVSKNLCHTRVIILTAVKWPEDNQRYIHFWCWRCVGGGSPAPFLIHLCLFSFLFL